MLQQLYKNTINSIQNRDRDKFQCTPTPKKKLLFLSADLVIYCCTTHNSSVAYRLKIDLPMYKAHTILSHTLDSITKIDIDIILGGVPKTILLVGSTKFVCECLFVRVLPFCLFSYLSNTLYKNTVDLH